MSNIQPYEVSLWTKERKIVQIGESYKTYFQDHRVCTLADDSDHSHGQIFNIVFNEKTDGSHSLSFQLFKNYLVSDVVTYNIFYGLLHNESLIKVFYLDEWYEFLIKDIDEDKNSNLITYTCVDAFIEELSKVGYNIVLDAELENNFGTVDELATTILADTNWTVDEDLSEVIMQKNTTPLYLGVALDDIIVTPLTNDFNSSGITTIPNGSTFYYCYQPFINRETALQIIYRADENYLYDDDFLIYNCDTFLAEDISYEGIGTIDIAQGELVIIEHLDTNISTLQGKQIIRTQLNQYETNSQKYVKLYRDDEDNIIYGYTESTYLTSDTVQNIITNDTQFTTLGGFKYKDGLDISTFIFPEYDASSSENLLTWLNADKTQYIKVKFTTSNALLCNTGVVDHRTTVNTLTTGEDYTLRLKYDKGSIPGSQANTLRAIVCKYTFTDSTFTLDYDNTYFTFDNLTVDGDYYVQTAACELTASKTDLLNVGIFLYPIDSSEDTYYFLSDLQLFKTIYNSDDELILPDTPITSEVKTKYIYFDLIEGETGEDAINYLYNDYVPDPTVTPIYDEEYNKIGSISGSESNCFNLLQDLAESFECWLKIKVDHETDGTLTLDENYEPTKQVYFKNYFGVDNNVGFHYGINLNNIQRKLISDDIVTKLIVKDNDNEYLTDGTCTVVRATDNISKERFILNFNYYINQGLLNAHEVLSDLYGCYPNDFAYLTKLGDYNETYDTNTTTLVGVAANLIKLTSQQTLYENAINAADIEIASYKNDLYTYSLYTYDEILAGSFSNLLQDQNIQDYLTSIQNLLIQRDMYASLLSDIEDQITSEEAIQTSLEEDNAAILAAKTALHSEFYRLYSPFIKEGEWVDNTYLDDNLYYLDSCSTLNNSSHPAVEYTITVLDLSGIEEFAPFTFKIGDKTFIQDEEYFGNILKEGLLTPARQEVIISEYSRTLDDPSQNKITVKTYKYSYSDLFQKITAQTQSLKFAEGSYGRAANAVSSNGTLNVQILENTLLQNSITLANAHNQSVIWDDDGVSIFNLLNPNEIVRLVSGGIFLSNNSGENWSLGITANGINTALLTAGQIDVNNIFIVNGTTPTFRWSADGINAYRWNEEDGSFDLSSFIRLDQYGLYGVLNGSDNFKPSGATLNDQIESIQNNAEFALLWDGFFLKSSGTAGYLKISSDYDIQIFQDVSQDLSGDYVARLTLGRIGGDIYGLRLKHADDTVALETDSDGDLTLQGIISITPEGVANPPTVKVGVVYTDETKTAVQEYISVKQGSTYKFKVDGDGNVSLTGTIYASAGTIGGFTINANSLSSTYGRVVLGPSAIEFYDKISTDPTREKIFSYSTSSGNGLMSLKGTLNITGASSILGTLAIGSTLDSTKMVLDGANDIFYHTNYYVSGGSSGFLIDSTGKIFARAIELGDYASIKNYLQMGNSYIYNPTYNNLEKFLSVQINGTEYASLNDKGILTVKRIIIDGSPETVSVNGVDYDTNTIIGDLLVTGNLTVGDDGIIINGIDGQIYSSSYADNNNTGWLINQDGQAIFNNIILRGKLQSSVFEFNKVSSIGGSLFISPSLQTEEEIIGAAPEDDLVKFTFITFVDDGSEEQIINQELYTVWENVDQATIDLENTLLTGNIIESSNEVNGDITTYYIHVYIAEASLTDYYNGSNYYLPAGTIVISTSTLVNNIELNATSASGPRISMTPNSGGIGTVYIGNLNSVVTDTFGSLEGYGFYGENVFLEGKLYLPNAGITNDGEDDDSIRIWAGASAADIENATFYVTQGGFLHASSGEFSGLVRNTVLETSAIVGDSGLGVYGNSPISFYSGAVEVDDEGVITGSATLKLTINSDGLIGIDSDILIQKTDSPTNLTILAVDTVTGYVTINNLLLNGTKVINLFEDTDHLNISYGQNALNLYEDQLVTTQITTDTQIVTTRMFIGDAQVYYLDIKNESDQNIGYDVYILS